MDKVVQNNFLVIEMVLINIFNASVIVNILTPYLQLFVRVFLYQFENLTDWNEYSIYLGKLAYNLHLSDFVINHFLLDALELIF